MKRIISILLVLLLLGSVMPMAAAAEDEAQQAAEELYALGLFKGTGTNADGTPIFDLDKTPSRNQAIIMLVRLLGKEEEALAGTWEIPFTDVSDSMKPYIGYAYAKGLTNGTTATTYSGTAPIKANQYVAFVLRALGYVSGADFTVSDACVFSDEIGLTRGQYSAKTPFTRGDIAIISNTALATCLKRTDDPLLEQLLFEGGVNPGKIVATLESPGMQMVGYDPVHDAESYYPQWDYATVDFNQNIDEKHYPAAYLYDLTEEKVWELETERGVRSLRTLLILFDGRLKLDHRYAIYIPKHTVCAESGDVYSKPILFSFETASNVVQITLTNRQNYLWQTATLERTDGISYQAPVNNGIPEITFTEIEPGIYTLKIQGEDLGSIRVGSERVGQYKL